MSKNHDLLMSIRDGLKKNPAMIGQIPIEDIIYCICYELNEIKQIYDPDHFSELRDKIISYAGILEEASQNKDSDSALVILEKLIELHYMLPDIEVALPFIEDANFDRAFNRHIIEGTIIVLGDSHSCFFSGNENLSLIPIKNGISTCNQNNNYPFTVLHLGPCLAFNSDRYGSQNRLREKIEWLDDNFFLPGDTIIVSLGEIDVRTHVYKYSGTEGDSYKKDVDLILSHYLKLLLWLKERGYKVICYGPIGSLKDTATLGDYRPRVGTEVQRNRAGRYYNEMLEKTCNEHGLEYFTLFYDMVSGDNVTDAKFLSGDELHLGQFGYHLAIRKLCDMGVISEVNETLT